MTDELHAQVWRGSSMMDSHLVDTDWLAARLGDPQVRPIDVRGHLHWDMRHELGPWRSAREDFDAAHIPGAVYLDFTRDLVDTDNPVPLQAASPARLAKVFGEAGIGDEHTVVAYDSDRSVFATRLWWLFRLCGRRNIRVLDGGWSKWRADGHVVTNGQTQYPPTTFTVERAHPLQIDIEDLMRSIERPDLCLVDARARQDYAGSPKWAERGGHIPGAVNLPASSLLREDGTFRPFNELEAAVSEVIPRRGRTVTYCGLGLSATAVAFVLDILGHDTVYVYDGSWAEWGARPDAPCVGRNGAV